MGRAAIRYAKAMLSLAQEKGITKDIQNDMQSIIATIDNSKDLTTLLNSPLVKNEIKLASLTEVFKDTDAITKQLFKVLIDNKRVSSLYQVAKSYGLLFDELNNIQVAKVTTAVPLNDALTETIKAKVKELTGNDATLESVVDESIIGGFVLRVGDLQYNASIAHKLTTLKRELSN